ncbi:MAG: protease modulator HflK, partial [Beijerinckiaceae bacterium]|nr:protease modulator HflK [Beijerinckiaceae bacterium]
MPWSNEGGNGGSWKPSGPGPWGQKPGAPPPEFEEFLKRAQEKLKQWIPGSGGMGGRGLLAGALVIAIIWLLSGFYTVGPNEVGLNKIFGRYTGKTAPGLNYNLPFPIGSVEKLQVTDRNTVNVGFGLRQDVRTPSSQIQLELPEESLMLTGDENIADVKFVVIWQIDPVHPENYAFNIANQRETVKAVAESAMREVIGRGQIQRILTSERQVIESDVQELMQKVLNSYKAGILVLQVQLQ